MGAWSNFQQTRHSHVTFHPLQERWIQGLLAFHLLLLILVVLYRRFPTVHAGIFLGMSEQPQCLPSVCCCLNCQGRCWLPLAAKTT
jgi:hypothetical protein